MFFSRRRGQALIIMIMVMAVSLTLGVAISSRVVTTLRQISYSAQSAEALALAEAGAEDGLKRIKDNPNQPCPGPASPPCSFNDVPLGNGTYSYTITTIAASPVFDKLSPISRDKAVQIDLNTYNANSRIYIDWIDNSKPSEMNDSAAVEASVIYQTGSVYKKRVFAWDPVVTRQATNKLIASETGANGYTGSYPAGTVTYRYRLDLPPLNTYPGYSSGDSYKLLRIRLLYNEVPNSVAVEAPVGNLPSQGVIITSTGYVGRVQRKVEVVRSQPTLSELFDFVLFSGSQSAPLSK